MIAFWVAPASGAVAAEVVSELFSDLTLVYEDRFDGALDPTRWEIRQGTTWEIRDGVLTGTPAPKEFQEKMIAKGDRAHAGFKPVIFLKQVPEHFVCAMRLRHDAEKFHPRFPLLDLGHHIHTVTFGGDRTTLTIRKDVETRVTEAPRFTLNEWHDVVLELTKGRLILSIDGVKHRFESPHIDMAGHSQIDFKGIDFGTWRIDDVRVWAGK
jgi:hypothetical protein